MPSLVFCMRVTERRVQHLLGVGSAPNAFDYRKVGQTSSRWRSTTPAYSEPVQPIKIMRSLDRAISFQDISLLCIGVHIVST
jgi:hypothetical protein